MAIKQSAMTKLSVVIITFNEERNIKRCLESVKEIADEIVVVDSFSTDKTKEIALQYKAVVIEHPFENYVAQHRFADQQAQHDLIFSIDADEAVSPELEKSILKVKENPVHDGYWVNRLTNYCGKWIHHSGWYPDRKLRLYNRTKGSWQGVIVHESFKLSTNTTENRLVGDLWHYSYYTVEQHRQRLEKYSTMSARAYYAQGKKVPFVKIWFSPVVKFIRDYFFNLGFLDGKAGLTICLISAGGTKKKYQKLKKLKKQDRR